MGSKIIQMYNLSRDIRTATLFLVRSVTFSGGHIGSLHPPPPPPIYPALASQVSQVFETVASLQAQGWSYSITAQFLEIYNDAVQDLLAENRPPLPRPASHASGGSSSLLSPRGAVLGSPRGSRGGSWSAARSGGEAEGGLQVVHQGALTVVSGAREVVVKGPAEVQALLAVATKVLAPTQAHTHIP